MQNPQSPNGSILAQPLTKSRSLDLSIDWPGNFKIPHSRSASANRTVPIAVNSGTIIEEEDITRSVNNTQPVAKRTIHEKIFVVWLILISVVLVVLLAIPPPPTVPVNFNLGCIPMAAAILTMLVDTIINRKYANDVIQKIDWTVILMFMGLFVWLEGFRRTCFTFKLFNILKPYMNLKKIQGVLLFSVFIIVGSNIF